MADTQNLLTYFTSDKDWKKKFIIGTVIYLAMFLTQKIPVLGALISFIVTFIMFGWQACTTNQRTIKQNDGIFGFYKFGQILMTGLKVSIATLIYFVVFGAGFFILLFVTSALGYLLKMGTMSAGQTIAVGMLAFILVLGIIALFLFEIYFLTSAYISFCFDLKYGSFFDFKKIGILIKKGGSLILSAIFKVVAIVVVYVVISMIVSMVLGLLAGFLANATLAQNTQAVLPIITIPLSLILAPLSFYYVLLTPEVYADCLRKIIAKNIQEG